MDKVVEKADRVLPSISEYCNSLAQYPHVFKTLRGIEPDRDADGNIIFRAGNNSVVFKISTQTGNLMLKCFFKHSLHQRSIYNYLRSHPDNILSHIKFLRKEMYVCDFLSDGDWYDIVVALWVEGNTLHAEIKKAAESNDRERLRFLSEEFDRLALEILNREWAHGDIKPENIIVEESGNMILIDYDAMYIPELAGEITSEIGTVSFQHPARDEKYYNEHIDDYSIALISVSLSALALSPELYVKYNVSDEIIMMPEDIVNHRCECHEKVLKMFIEKGDFVSYNLTLSLFSETPEIENLRDLLERKMGIYSSDHVTRASVAEKQSTYTIASNPELEYKNSFWGFCDENGNTLIEHVFEQAVSFREGYSLVRLYDTLYIIDTEGKVVIDGKHYENLKPFSEGLAPYCENSLWGYIDTSGRVIIKPRFDKAFMMHEGRAVVKLKGRYGYIDRSGNFIVKPQFSCAMGFRNGIARVYQDISASKIDLFGNKI